MPTIDSGKSIHRLFKGPLDCDLKFSTIELATQYVENPASSAYRGQMISVSNESANESICYRVDYNGTKLILVPFIVASNLNVIDAVLTGGILDSNNYPSLTILSPTADIIDRVNALTEVLTNSLGNYSHRGILDPISYPDLPPAASTQDIVNRVNALTQSLIIS